MPLLLLLLGSQGASNLAGGGLRDGGGAPFLGASADSWPWKEALMVGAILLHPVAAPSGPEEEEEEVPAARTRRMLPCLRSLEVPSRGSL